MTMMPTTPRSRRPLFSSLSMLGLLGASLLACAGPAQNTQPDDANKAAKPGEPCSDNKDCYNKAAQALQAKDNAKALPFLPRACDHEPKACMIAGQMLQKGDGVPADVPKAADFFGKACNGGIIVGCAIEADLRYKGEGGTPVDKARARTLYEKTCGPEMLENCGNAGIMFATGDGGPEDKTKARGFYDMACGGNDAQSCVAGGVMYLNGDGGAKDEAKAKTYFEKACEGKSADGCFNLAVIHGKGIGVTVDINKYKELMQKACAMGSAKGCDAEKQLAADMERAKQPPAKGPAKGKK
jgi:hypothetical protein